MPINVNFSLVTDPISGLYPINPAGLQSLQSVQQTEPLQSVGGLQSVQQTEPLQSVGGLQGTDNGQEGGE